MGNERMRLMGLVAVVLAAATLTGCNSTMRNDMDRLRTENTDLRAELDRARAAMDAAGNERESLIAEIQRLNAQLANASRPAPAPVTSNTGFENIESTETIRGTDRITVRVEGDVLFASGKTDLRAESKNSLRQVADVIKRQYAGHTVRIEGHTDSDPIRRSKWKDNYELAEARAAAVRDHLASLGVSRSQMTLVSHGPDSPVASNASTAGKAKNRRVEIVVMTN